MLLAINLGNTNAQIGKFDGDRLVAIEKGPVRTPDLLLRSAGFDEIDAIWIASVNRSALTAWLSFLEGRPASILKWSPELGIPTSYQNPTQIGADRLANALALQAQGPLPAVSVDIGTAVTFEVVDESGCFRGGPILPGGDLMAKALNDYTSLLPLVDPWDSPSDVLTSSTEEAIRAGIQYGLAGAVEGVLDEIAARLGQGPRVVLTGGGAGIHLRRKTEQSPELTLQGLQVAFARLG